MLDLSKRSTSSGLNNCDDDIHQITTSDPGTSEQKHVEKHEQDNPEITSGQEKIVKKPDKILPCPRCHSLETKFCYYNNYNVNQPRYFCKKCQRYWTAGGSMRNLSGKRKRKSSPSLHCDVVIPSDGLVGKRTAIPQPRIYSVQADSLSVHLPEKDLNRNGTALKFKPEGPLCESMPSVLNLGDKNSTGVDSLHCHGKSEEGFRSLSAAVSKCVENDNLKVESGMVSNSIYSSLNGFTLPNNMLCFPAPPWAWTWPTGWNNIASVNVNTNPVPWPQALASSIHSPPFMSFLFYPATRWGHIPCWPKAMWNLPSSSACETGCSNNSSPTLGKHSRDPTSEAKDKTEKILWVPKTLRIDDPDEAAKSSIWATLGITPGKSFKRGAIFETFSSNSEENQSPDATRVLHANPAAIARSQKLQESA